MRQAEGETAGATTSAMTAGCAIHANTRTVVTSTEQRLQTSGFVLERYEQITKHLFVIRQSAITAAANQ
jgi:hypothetical protein